MAGDALEPMPMSPRRSPAELGNAAVQWARSRRGRFLIVAAVFVVVALGFAARGSETISSSYQALSSNYHLPSWRPHLPHLPSIISSPLKPSNTTLELENEDIKHVPSHLNKATPNFHLLMPALSDTPDFCKTTLSAMMLSYPPPTIVNLYEAFEKQADREKARLKSILGYLKNEKLVGEEDLLLIVDGTDTWFQLPSHVVIRQYQILLDDANKRLGERYGKGLAQTIVFAAEKACEGEDMACKYARKSWLPDNIYGEKTGMKVELSPAKYLDSAMVMGPAKDMRTLYEAAVKKFEDKNSQSATVQSVMATIFGEQQLARDAQRKKPSKLVPSKWLDWFGGSAAEPVPEEQEQVANVTLDKDRQYEFSIGLDYTHTLFQPLLYCAEDELVPLPHDNSTDLSTYHHEGTPTPPLKIPTALQQANPPFWTPDLSHNNPSPNSKTAYIDKLAIDETLDKLPARETPWASLNLIQNTYTGAIPALLHINNRVPKPENENRDPLPKIPDPRAHAAPSANVSWNSLWYAGHERALLRKTFRTPQSPIGYHSAAIGGDRLWDQRGGRGGVWTATNSLWLPWGEVDGVCGTVKLLNSAFEDGKGVWLHEKEGDAEKERLKEEDELRVKIEEMREKMRIWAKEDEKKEKEAKQKQQKEKEAKEKEGDAPEGNEPEGERIQTDPNLPPEKPKDDKASGGRRRRRWMA